MKFRLVRVWRKKWKAECLELLKLWWVCVLWSNNWSHAATSEKKKTCSWTKIISRSSNKLLTTCAEQILYSLFSLLFIVICFCDRRYSNVYRTQHCFYLFTLAYTYTASGNVCVLNDVVAHSTLCLLVCSKFMVVKLPRTIQKENRFGCVDQTIEILCFVFLRPLRCVVNLVKGKTWSLLVDWPLAHSRTRSCLSYVPCEPATFSCLIICYYIVISSALHFLFILSPSLSPSSHVCAVLLLLTFTTISKYCWKSILEMN